MENYKERIIASHKEFTEERRLINLLSSINEKNRIQLQNETNKLLSNSATISRFHYMIITPKAFDYEESVFWFGEKLFEPLSKGAAVQKRKQLLGKADFFAYQDLIQFLLKDPSLFSQIIYFMLVNSNFSESANNEFNLLSDDRIYFCYYTFPSIFTFFFTKQDRSRALQFIESIFKLHIYLHGFQFSKSHTFLNDLIFSFFLTTNPTYFFENTVTPLLPDLIVDLPDSSTAYVKTKEGILLRRRYWLAIIKFVNELFVKMKNAIMLLPQESLELISTISSIESGDFPFNYLFIIDAIFCTYLQKFVRVEQHNLMSDVCQIIYCYFPQDKLPSPLYDQIKPFLKASTVVDDFLDSIISRCQQNLDDKKDGLTIGIQISKSSTYLTPRDINIIYNGVKRFQSNCNDNCSKQFMNLSKNIQCPPDPKIDNQFIQFDLSEKVPVLEEIDKNLTDPINNFIDVIDLLDIATFDFSTPEELKDIILNFGNSYLDTSQYCQILSCQKISISDPEMLSKVKSMRLKVTDNSDKFYQGLIFVQRTNREQKIQNLNLSTIFAKNIFIPLLIERFPDEFYFNDKDLLIVNATYSRFLKNISNHVSSLKEEYQFLIKRCFLFVYIDQIDIAIEFQRKINSKHNSKVFADYMKDNKNLEKLKELSPHIFELVNFAATLIQKVKTNQRISENVVLVSRAMRILKPFDDESIRIAISLSMNPEIFGFSDFAKVYLIKEEVIRYVFNQEDLQLLQRFQENLDKFKSEKIYC